MKISLIIPSRDRVSYLKRCIENIENQYVKPEEIIIILHEQDLASEKFITNISSNLNIKYFKTDGGSCKARNLGIEHSSGDLLVFLEDDDILEENYIKNLIQIFQNNQINVLSGYVFDIEDLITPWYINKSELWHIYNHRNSNFYNMIIQEISERSKGKINLNLKFLNGYTLVLFKFSNYLRNFLKYLVIQDWPIKGKILTSGYRSVPPTINEIKGLKKIEWFFGGNFAIRKNIINKFRFNEDMELLPYALCEDLELSARIGIENDIFISSDIVIFHLRSPIGIKMNQRERFQSMIVNYYRVAEIRGNKWAYCWSITGILLSRIFKLPFSYSESISEIKGIFDGIKYLRS
jgi:glycosyltransferase involved in cell wall biosynthesis